MTRAITIFLLITLSLPLRSQTETKKENLFWRTVEWVNRNFVSQDTIYVSPEKYNLFITPRYTFKDERYRFHSTEGNQIITLRPNIHNTIGANFGWRWISVGYSVALNSHTPEIDIDLGLYTSGLGLELLLNRRSEGYRIEEVEGFGSNASDLRGSPFNGFTITQGGAKLTYVFNYRRFSFPAAYSHTRNQRINAGSFIIGATYHQKIFRFDHTKLPEELHNNMHETFKFNELRYMNISVNGCYSYNWVFAKDFVANISATASVGYKGNEMNTQFRQNINFDLQARAAVVYNNQRYFAGASFLAHSFFYNSNTMRLEQDNCTLKVYAGFNFLRRKK